MIFVAAVLISGPLFFRNRVVMVACAARNQCAMVLPGELFQDVEFRTAYHALWAALGTFLPLVILLGTSCGLVMVLYRSRTAGIASPDRYPCTRVTATVAAVVITYLVLVCPSTLTEVLVFVFCYHISHNRIFSWLIYVGNCKCGHFNIILTFHTNNESEDRRALNLQIWL